MMRTITVHTVAYKVFRLSSFFWVQDALHLLYMHNICSSYTQDIWCSSSDGNNLMSPDGTDQLAYIS